MSKQYKRKKKHKKTNSISILVGEAQQLNQQRFLRLIKRNYAAPTVANPVETTPVKTEKKLLNQEKVEEKQKKKEKK